MPLHEKLICSSLIIAEKLLYEADHVVTPIRLVDIFWHAALSTIPSGFPSPAVQMALLFTGKFDPSADLDSHTIEIRLIRPNGESKTIGDPLTFVLESTIPEAPKALNFMVPQLNILIKQDGVHYFAASIDSIEV